MQSETIGKLAEALAKAQKHIDGAKKGAVNPHLRSKYADLSSVWAACRDALADNGLAVTQHMADTGAPGSVKVVTTLMHASGEWLSGETVMPVTKQDAHGYGSAITYARRYSLAAMVGVSPEDDDASAAVAHSAPEAKAQQKPPAKAEPKKADGPARDSQAAKELYAAISGAKSLTELAEVGNTINKRKAELAKAELTTLQDDYLAMKKLLEGA